MDRARLVQDLRGKGGETEAQRRAGACPGSHEDSGTGMQGHYSFWLEVPGMEWLALPFGTKLSSPIPFGHLVSLEQTFVPHSKSKPACL